MKIKVRNLLPNPFRNIDAYPIDREKIEQLRNSIRETTFWDNVLARPAPKNQGKYQIAYGHHRLIAIKEEFGEERVIDIPVRDLSDEDMLRIMANENMEQWATDWRVIVETLKGTREFLRKHPDIAKRYGTYEKVGTIAISRFLGKNWSERLIQRALAIMNDEEIQEIFPKEGLREKLDITTLERISSIEDKEVKKQWIEKAAEKDISTHEMEEIARFEKDPTLTIQDKQTLRSLIQQDEIRGKEQVRRTYQIYRAQRLTMPKTTPEKERKKKQIEEHLLEIAKEGGHLAELITALAGQVSSYPETLELFPPEETAKANLAMRELARAIGDYREKYDMAKSRITGKQSSLEGD